MSALLLRAVLIAPFLVTSSVLAHEEKVGRFGRHLGGRTAHLKRQEPYPSESGPAYSVPPLESITPVSAGYTENTLPVEATYAPGTQPTLASAPPLPAGKSLFLKHLQYHLVSTYSLFTLSPWFPSLRAFFLHLDHTLMTTLPFSNYCTDRMAGIRSHSRRRQRGS
jgi:hypothetical protein